MPRPRLFPLNLSMLATIRHRVIDDSLDFDGIVVLIFMLFDSLFLQMSVLFKRTKSLDQSGLISERVFDVRI